MEKTGFTDQIDLSGLWQQLFLRRLSPPQCCTYIFLSHLHGLFSAEHAQVHYLGDKITHSSYKNPDNPTDKQLHTSNNNASSLRNRNTRAD